MTIPLSSCFLIGVSVPRKMIEIYFNLSDYFSKYGFGDGDERAASEWGYSLRDDAAEILEKSLHARGFAKYTVKGEDIGSIHNECYLVIRDENDVEVEVEPDETGGIYSCRFDMDEEPDAYNRFFKAWRIAFDEFEEIFTKEEDKK
jgi:hypothetical protein